jgi:glycine/D-amino acid oxidase-like deaminating enzyme
MKHSCYWFDTSTARASNGIGFVKNVDVLVIGGGLAGMSTLFQLIRGGISNAYLLEEATVGHHASGRSSGQIMLRGRDLFTQIADKYGEAVAKEYLIFSAANIRKFIWALHRSKFDVDLIENGGMRLATTKEELDLLQRECSFINKNENTTGIKCIEMTEGQIRAVLPSRGFIGGIYLASEATVNPYKIINSVRDIIETGGARVLTNSCVDNINRNDDGTFSVSIRHKGVILAKKVVYCTGAYTSGLLPEMEQKIIPFRGQMVATDILPDPVLQILPTMSISCNNNNDYMRLHAGKLLFGGERNNIRGNQAGIIYDGEVSQTVFKRQKDFLQQHMPFIAPKFTHIWAGVMSQTADGFPLVGEVPGHKNEFIMAGFDGYGLSHIYMASLIMRDLIIQGKSNLPCVQLFNPGR